MPVFLVLLGVLIRVIALRKIGLGFWRIIPPCKLITEGIYSKIRHPMYLGSIILSCGLFLLLTDIKTTLCLMYLTIQFLLDRIDREEQIMTIFFKDKYIDYVKRTKMLIPFIF
jgi:protein-S-isoprenylcysteine O-methyltransferase Ste14